MLKLINHIPHISFAALVNNDIVGEATLKMGLMRQRKGKATCWPHIKEGREVWLNYEGLAPKYQEAIKNRIGDPYQATAQQATSQAIRQHVSTQAALLELHARYHQMGDVQHYRINHKLATDKAQDLAWGAAWLRMLDAHKTSTDTKIIGYDTKMDLRNGVLAAIVVDSDNNGTHRYGFKVQNLRVLQNKELDWRKAQQAVLATYEGPQHKALTTANNAALDGLVPGYFGNTNTQIIGRTSHFLASGETRCDTEQNNTPVLLGDRLDISEFHAATILYLFMNPGKANKFDFENIHYRYTRECAKQNQKPVSISALKHFLNRNEVRQFATLERDGMAAYETYLPHVYGKRPQMSLSKGGYDGFQVDFYTNVEQMRVMLTCVAVFDYASEAVTGFDVGLVEDGRMVRNMYLNHLNLNGGRSYMEIESDRFSGNLAKETQRIFTACCNTVTQPKPNDPRGLTSNPKARFVERLLQELNRLTQNVDGWKGTNITSIDRQRKPNTELGIQAQETYAHGVKQLIALVGIYNNQPIAKYNGKSRMEMYLENLNPAAPVVAPETRATLLNQWTIATVNNAKVLITVNRRTYEYAWPQYHQHLQHMAKGNKVRVYFDETDMDEVTVFGYTDKADTDTDRYLCSLTLLERAQRSVAEQTPADLARIGQMDRDRASVLDNTLRKQVEWEASVLGIELLEGATIAEKRAIVAGERNRQQLIETTEELYADALATPSAQQSTDYYTDRLLRTQGHAVPVEKETSTQSKRDFIKNRTI
jgi:hypothetical protein